MKKVYFLLIASALSTGVFAQGVGGHGKNAQQDAYDISGKGIHYDHYHDHYHGKKGPKGHKDEFKPAKNIPAMVAEAFYRDYPRAANTAWTKSKCDWKATFNSGLFGANTAIYHANGDRLDARSTRIPVSQAPRPVWEEILRRFPKMKKDTDITRLEGPGGDVRYNLQFDDEGKSNVISFDEKGNEF